MGLATDDGELLIAGEQLFCTGSTEAVVYQHRTSAGSLVDASERLEMPLVTAFSRTLEHIAARNGWDPLLLRSGQQLRLSVVSRRRCSGGARQCLCASEARPARPGARRALRRFSLHHLHGGSGERRDRRQHPHGCLETPQPAAGASIPQPRTHRGTGHWGGSDVPVDAGASASHRRPTRPPQTRFECRSWGGSAVLAFARFVASMEESRRDDVEALLVLRRLCEVSSTSSADMAPLFQRSVDEAHEFSEAHVPGTLPAHRATSCLRKHVSCALSAKRCLLCWACLGSGASSPHQTPDSREGGRIRVRARAHHQRRRAKLVQRRYPSSLGDPEGSGAARYLGAHQRLKSGPQRSSTDPGSSSTLLFAGLSYSLGKAVAQSQKLVLPYKNCLSSSCRLSVGGATRR